MTRVNDGPQHVEAIDQVLMTRCIELFRIGEGAGELPFGSLVVHRGQIIAEATNEIVRFVDEPRHAEIIAIARARHVLGDQALSSCTLYSTVETCPMCSFCIRTSGIGRVVFALSSPKMGGLSRWNILGDDQFPLLFGRVPELVSGILADDAHQVWIELKPMISRAMLWFGFISKPTATMVGDTPGSRYRYSLRRLISMFLKKRKPTWKSTVANAVQVSDFHFERSSRFPAQPDRP